MSKTSKTIGAAGEDQGEAALARVGVFQIEKIGTPAKYIPINAKLTLQSIFKIVFGEKVIGDRRGVARGGLSVLAEVKTCFDRNLQWSDLRPHQPKGLTDHDALGGISLIVWVTDNGVHVMRWPIDGFGPGKGLTKEKADSIAITDEAGLLAGKNTPAWF
jgi:hypothetical protein